MKAAGKAWSAVSKHKRDSRRVALCYWVCCTCRQPATPMPAIAQRGAVSQRRQAAVGHRWFRACGLPCSPSPSRRTGRLGCTNAASDARTAGTLILHQQHRFLALCAAVRRPAARHAPGQPTDSAPCLLCCRRRLFHRAGRPLWLIQYRC